MSFLLLAKLSSRLSRLRSLLTLAGAATAGACSADEALAGGQGTVQPGEVWGLEFTNSDPVRTTSSTSSHTRPNTVVNNAPRGHHWSANRVHRDPASSSWKHAGTRFTWSGWRSATGLGGSDRAHVVVYNWDRQGSVAVDLSKVLPVGGRYEVRYVQNYFGSPVASGRFGGGSITLPLPSVRAPPPVGWSSSRVKSTGTEFQVFVVSVAQQQ